MKICVISFNVCPCFSKEDQGANGIGFYLKEVFSMLTRRPEIMTDLYTREHFSDGTGIYEISPSFRITHLGGGPPSLADEEKLFGFLPGFMNTLDSYIREQKITYDMIYSHDWLSGLAGEWIKQNFNIPLIHAFHASSFSGEDVSGMSGSNIQQMAEDHIVEIADHIIFSSQQDKKYLTENYDIGADEVDVIPSASNKESRQKAADALFDIFNKLVEKRKILL